MANHESEEKVSTDSASPKFPNSSSPLRKKKSVLQNSSSVALVENNDEAERLALRQEINITRNASANSSKNDKRHSLGLRFLSHMSQPQLAERITECIKLSAENKINAKNAFSMEIIDFMTYMIKKQDVNMTNLQVASTSLDVSTKIYGFRVDGVHTQILQMIGGLDKQEKRDEALANGEDGQTTVHGDEDNGSKKQLKKKMKRNKHKMFYTVENLRGTVETAKPSLMMIGHGDSQTTDTLNQVSLPNHANTGFYLHTYNDVIVDTIEHKEQRNRDVTISIPRVENFSELELCPSLPNFEFHGWSQDNEPDEKEETEPEKKNDNNFQFDLDASLLSDDEPADDCHINYFDMNDEEDNMDRCVQVPTSTEKIVDLQKVVTATTFPKPLEYSFIQKSKNMHWAGPSHWKLSSIKRALGDSRVIETCQQGPGRKKKEAELRFDRDTMKSLAEKFKSSNAVKLQAKSTRADWHEGNVTLPTDVHYDISSTSKLYLYLSMKVNCGDQEALDVTHVSDVVQDYNYNNDNDTSNYCPDVETRDYATGEENNDDHAALEKGCESEEYGVLTGDNLITAPKLTNKISIAYSLRAKRVDMQQLKRSIWKELIAVGDKENLDIQEAVAQETRNKMKGEKRFSEVYKKLPNTLSKTNVESLSFPISFVSLLHLANEKTLSIKSLPDMSDIVIEEN